MKAEAFKKRLFNTLSKEQQAHYQTIRWLYDASVRARNTGRTFLLAVVYINTAIDNPGLRIIVEDRYSGVPARAHLMHTIKSLLVKEPELLKRFTFYHGSFRFD